MRPVSDLAKLQQAVSFRLDRLRRLYNAGADPAVGRPELIPHCVIELDNVVLGAMRMLWISSMRNARTISGTRVCNAIGTTDEREIAAFALSILNSSYFDKLGKPTRIDRRQEPTVRDPRDFEKVFAAAGLTNTPSLQTAMALNTTLFQNLGTIRNFYAHRNSDTWGKARRKGLDLGIFHLRTADDIVTALLPGRSVRLYEDWLDDAEWFFQEACR